MSLVEKFLFNCEVWWRCNSVIRAIRGHLSPSDQQSKLRQGLMGKQSGVFVTWYSIPMQSNAKLIRMKTGSINKDKIRFKAKKVYKLKDILHLPGKITSKIKCLVMNLYDDLKRKNICTEFSALTISLLPVMLVKLMCGNKIGKRRLNMYLYSMKRFIINNRLPCKWMQIGNYPSN